MNRCCTHDFAGPIVSWSSLATGVRDSKYRLALSATMLVSVPRSFAVSARAPVVKKAVSVRACSQVPASADAPRR